MLRLLLLLLFAGLPSASAFGSLFAKEPSPPPRSEARRRIESLIPARTSERLNDPQIGEALQSLKATATNKDKIFDPKAVAGKWRVIHAPHLAFLSQFALTKFQPIEYYLTKDGKMAASVRYKSNIFGEGWLNTAGYYSVEESTGNVVIVWDKTWWNNQPLPRPTPPQDGYLAELIQSLGDLGFLENLSFFPIQYVDESLAVFQFFGLTITASRFDKSEKNLYISAKR